MSVTELPPIDHNQPDPIGVLFDELEIESDGLLGRADELLASAAAMPDEIADEETAKKATDLAGLLGACLKAAEQARVERKAPYLAGGRAIDTFYQSRLLDRLDDSRQLVLDRLWVWLMVRNTVRGDTGALATLRAGWTYRDLDYDALDLEALRPYFSPLDIARALRQGIREGLRDIRGATIYEEQTTVVR